MKKLKNFLKRYRFCFKQRAYVSEIDQFLEEVRQKGLHHTTGYQEKVAYYQQLSKKRDGRIASSSINAGGF